MIKTSITAVVCFALLFPLVLIFMQGPSVTVELSLGAIFAFTGLFLSKQMENVKRVVPYLACLFVYIGIAYYWKDINNELTAKYTIGLILYLIPTGLLLRTFVDRGQGNGVVLGFALFTFAVSAVGLVVLRTVGVENLVKIVGLGLSRSNIEDETFTYMHYFTITNVIIGMSTFSICGLATIVVLSLNVPIAAKIVCFLAFSVALYTNVEVLTRGAVVSAALGVICALPMVSLKMGLKKVVKYSIASFLALGCLFGYVVISNGVIMDKVRVLTERISQTGDDTRLTHWQEAFGLIQRNPLGGGRVFMQTHTWAHNLFLDTALTAGIPGLLAVLAFFLLATLHIFRVLIRGRRTLHPAFLVLLAQFLAVFVLTMTSPPSLPLFGILLLVAGFFAKPYSLDDQVFD